MMRQTQPIYTPDELMVEAHSGQIEVESQPGQGSRFAIKFPVLSKNEAQKKTLTNPLPDDTSKKNRILIVDDEQFVALTLKEGLERLPNCEILIAVSGQQALQFFDQQPFDLVFTDYKMADMDGLHLTAHLQQIYPQAIVIMITAYSNDELYEQAARLSIRYILNKPVEFNEVRQVALEALAEIET